MDNNISEATVNVEGTGRKRKPLNKYVKIGLVAFIVIALSIWFYYTFFEQHSLFGFLEVAVKSLRPFIIGAILAYLLKPICAVFEKWLSKAFVKVKNRNTARNLTINIAIGLTAVLFLAVVYVMFAAVIPQVVDSAKAIAGNVPGWIDSATAWLENVTKNAPEIQAKIKDFSANFAEKMTEIVNKFMASNDNASTIIFSVTAGVKETLILLKDILIGGVSCIYILHERKKFAAQGKMLVYGIFKKRWADKIMEEVHFTDKMFGGYINGTIIDSFIIGLICFALCAICKVPYAVLVSVIVGVTNIIPFFGPFIGGIPAVMIVLMVSPLRGLYLALIIIAIQQFDGNILKPKILGNSTGVSSFWVLFSISFFGGIWGFGGMVLGVPLFAVVYDLIRQLIVKGLKKHEQSELYEEYREDQNILMQSKAEAKARRVGKLTKMKKFKVNKEEVDKDEKEEKEDNK
jgi:predicted PurR-regulated permease PerM